MPLREKQQEAASLSASLSDRTGGSTAAIVSSLLQRLSASIEEVRAHHAAVTRERQSNVIDVANGLQTDSSLHRSIDNSNGDQATSDGREAVVIETSNTLLSRVDPETRQSVIDQFKTIIDTVAGNSGNLSDEQLRAYGKELTSLGNRVGEVDLVAGLTQKVIDNSPFISIESSSQSVEEKEDTLLNKVSEKTASEKANKLALDTAMTTERSTVIGVAENLLNGSELEVGEPISQQLAPAELATDKDELQNDTFGAGAPEDKSSGTVYNAEDFTIQRSGNQTTISDKSGNVLFEYITIKEEDKPEKKEVTKDRLTGDRAKFKVFEQAHANIKKNSLKAILSDPTGRNQVENLGGLVNPEIRLVAIASYGTSENRKAQTVSITKDEERFIFQKEAQGYSVRWIGKDGQTVPPGEQTIVDSKGANFYIGNRKIKVSEIKEFKIIYEKAKVAAIAKNQEAAQMKANAKKPKLKDKGGRD